MSSSILGVLNFVSNAPQDRKTETLNLLNEIYVNVLTKPEYNDFHQMILTILIKITDVK